MPKLAAAFALAVALFTLPARAASPMTEAFLGNVAANLTILDVSSRLAQDHTRSAALKSYAASETKETRQVAVALTESIPSENRVASAPEAIAPDTMKTGRSVAVAGLAGETAQGPAPDAANGRAPATADLATLKTLHGEAFDRLYFVLQLDALSQIESDYRAYIDNGDDLAIAAMAHAQLPGLLKRLEALSRV